MRPRRETTRTAAGHAPLPRKPESPDGERYTKAIATRFTPGAQGKFEYFPLVSHTEVPEIPIDTHCASYVSHYWHF